MGKHPIPEDALDADIAILAKKGAGKTYTAKGIVERLLDDGARVLVLDPLSTWWGLKSSADGESPGYPVAVFGGPHGDMELTEGMARPLAQIIAKENLPAVMDIAFMKKAEQQRFTRDLLEELFAINRDPLTLVLEEAHVFAPQSVAGADASAFHEVDRIARMGRAFGFRLISITQRASRLHKDVLTQAATMIAQKVQHQLDQKPIIDWFTANADRDFAKTVEAGLANLKVGEAYVGATDQDFFERVKFPKIRTLDSSATPKRGQKRIEPKTLAEVDLTAVRAALSLPEEEPVSKSAPKNWQAETDRLVKQVRAEAYEEGFKAGHIAGTTDGINRGVEALRGLLATDPRPAKAQAPRPAKSSPKPKPQSGDNPFVEAARMIWPVRLTWAGLASVLGRKARGGHFNTQRKAALDSGTVREESGLVVLTNPPDAGGRDPVEMLRQNLPGGARDLFSSIVDNPGLPLTAHAALLGRKATGGHWNTSVSVLRQNGLIEETAAGVAPAAMLTNNTPDTEDQE